MHPPGGSPPPPKPKKTVPAVTSFQLAPQEHFFGLFLAPLKKVDFPGNGCGSIYVIPIETDENT